MEINKLCAGTLFVIGFIITTGFFINLHNIDLVFNTINAPDLMDCNGIVCRDVTSIYQTSILYLWAYPILMCIIIKLYYYFKNGKN